MPTDGYDATGRMLRPWDAEKEEYKQKYGFGIDWLLAQAMEIDAGFQKAMVNTRTNEGGYNNNPDDRGLETNFGISKRAYPNEDIKNMTRERADYLLYRDYYKTRGIDKLPEKTREVVFDNAVVQGQPTAVMTLQKIVNTKQDGFIGNDTLNRLGQYNESDVISNYKTEVRNKANKIAEDNPTQKQFHRGWLNRADRY